MPLNTTDGQDFARLIQGWTTKQIQQHVSEFSLEQLAIAITVLSGDHDFDWQEKLEALFSGLSEDKQLETVARSLSSSQFFCILNFCNIHNQRWKLPQIFVAMPPEIFKEVLLNASEDQLNILKQESVTEPLQLHLLHLLHDLTSQLQELITAIEILENEIELIDAATIQRGKIEFFIGKIEQNSLKGREILYMIDKGLSLVWMTGRGDLIEKFSSVKEKSQRCLYIVIGHPRAISVVPTGLYKYLEDCLYAIYNKSNNDSDVFFDDSDSAIEAISYFSIWHLEDYAKIGLLDSNTPLELDSERHSEQERAEYRSKLFNAAKNRLESLGLVTLHDLKKAWIFSKEMLKEYILLTAQSKKLD